MPITFLRRTTATASAASLTFDRPGIGESVEPLQSGDFIAVFLGVGDRTVEAGTLALPPDWFLVESGFTDGAPTTRLFAAFHYIIDIAAEPTTYTFTYSAVRALVGVALAYRGVQRDMSNPTVYPYGYFTPDTQQLSGMSGTGQTTSTLYAETATHAFTQVLRVLLFNHAVNVPKLDDPIPLVPIRAYVRGQKAALMVLDNTIIDLTEQADPVVVSADASGPYLCVTYVFEPLVDTVQNANAYKVATLKSFFCAPYATDATPLDRLLTVIGTLDNDIG